nr:putative late blight resistance protein homolog R1B-14 [Ipomoea batatas]
MADAVVGQLVNRLVQVVDENVVLIKEIKNQVDTLVGDLKSLEAYLKQASKKQSASDNDVLKDVVDKIRGVVSDAEDAISKYTVERKKYKDKGWVRCFQSPAYYARVKASAKEIQGIIEKVQRIRTNHANDLKELIHDNPKDQPAALPIMAPVVEEVDVVGFDNEAKTIKGAKSELNKMPRRICVHSTVLDFLKLESKPSSEHVHSFLSFCSNEIEIPNEHLAVIPKSFRLLRVMDVESLKFKLFPRQLYELSHLRYLAVSTELKVLPVVFNKLWNLQTLVFKTSENSLEVKADMWSMSKLRHVHSNTSMVLPPPPKNTKNSSGSTDIQTLSTISPSSCTAEILEKTPNLQKLGIRGNLAEVMESKGGVILFDNLQILDCLENLKLINNALQNSKLRRCPHSEKFPRRLRKMTLSNTTFEWKDLNILSLLEELEVLKLEENAFRGEFCDVSNIVFKQLRYLRIGRTNLVSWKVSKDSFQALKYLILRHCNVLESVPSVFGEVESLKVMELFCTNGRAANSAREIQNLKNKRKCGFQLSIYPPDH